MRELTYGRQTSKWVVCIVILLVVNVSFTTYTPCQVRPTLTLQDANNPRISGNGRRLLVSPGGDTAEVFDLITGRKLQSFRVPNSFAAEISADGEHVAIFGATHVPLPNNHFESVHDLWLYNVDSGKLLRHENVEHLPRPGEIGQVSDDLRFVADNLRLLTEKSPDKPIVFLAELSAQMCHRN